MNKPIPPHMIFLLAQKSQQGKSILKQIDNLWEKLVKQMIKEMK
jgi:hypothetical protein